MTRPPIGGAAQFVIRPLDRAGSRSTQTKRGAIAFKIPSWLHHSAYATRDLEHGDCTSLYVTDPNGMVVELTVDAPNADRIAADRRNDTYSGLRRWLASGHTSNNSYR